MCIPRSCPDLPLETIFSPVFANLHCICCKPHSPIVTTAFSCFFWVSWYFCVNYLTRGKPRTTLFLSLNTPKAKFSLITALDNFPDNLWLLWVFTHEPKLSQKRVSRVKTLCMCMSTLLVIVHIWLALPITYVILFPWPQCLASLLSHMSPLITYNKICSQTTY